MTATDTATFLAAHFGDLAPDQQLELRTFHRGGKRDGKPGPRLFTSDIDKATLWVRDLPAGLDVYYSVNYRRQGGGGKKADVKSIRAICADVDDKHFADGRAGALATLATFALPPSAVIDSGGGLQGLWYLEEPLRISAPDDPLVPMFEDLQKRLYEALGGLDAVQDISRVFRLPGTLNAKYDPPRPVAVIEHNHAALYTLSDFERVLPAPALRPGPAVAYPKDNHRTGDIPTLDDLGEMLRVIPPEPGYHEWLRILASVHSAYPGPDGQALCEAWSGHVSKPGEIAEKFASFGKYRGPRGNATIGTVIYEARRHGYQPRQGTYHHSSPSAGEGYVADGAPLARLAELEREVAALRRENAEQAVALERCGAESARKDARIAELQREVAALEAAIKHPDQAAGIGALDLFDASTQAYQRGEVFTKDGKDYARVPFAQAAKRRSAKTVARGFKTLCDAGTLEAFTRDEQIETPQFKGKVPVAYVHIAPEQRGQRGKAVLGILPTCAVEKKHGGRRTIPVPEAVAAQDNPVRRKREHVTRWIDALTDRPLTTQTEHLGTDYWTAQGEQLLPEEVERRRVAAGYEPPRVPTWRPAQPALRVYRDPRQDADKEPFNTSRQDADPPADDSDGNPEACSSPGCPAQKMIGGYCAVHFDMHRDEHRRRFAGDTDEPLPLHDDRPPVSPTSPTRRCLSTARGCRNRVEAGEDYCPACARQGYVIHPRPDTRVGFGAAD